MNYGIIIYVIGLILKLEAVLLTIPLITATIYKEKNVYIFLIVMLILYVIGKILTIKKPKSNVFHLREGFVTAALSWVVLSLGGALPFYLSKEIHSVIDCLFETVSGFTTTGASILDNVEKLSHSMLIWRSFTHWIGGMGVIVFILCLFPMTEGYNINLMKAESPGPKVSRLVPKVRNTAIILYSIYFSLTLLQMALMLVGKMPIFDTLCISFGTAGTGGFGIKNDSLAGYSVYIQTIVTIFMFLFGVNFNVYFLIIMKKWKNALKNEEVKYYFLIVLLAIVIITWNIRGMYTDLPEGVLQGAFQVVSIITTTGYSTIDFNKWPEVSRTILVILMFVGACAGSTGGGIKVSRVVILCKTVKKELYQLIHPRAIKKIKMDKEPIAHNVLRSINIFVIAYVLIFALSVLLVGFDDFDFTTNFTSVAATFNNIGPGLELVGPTANFGHFSILSKTVLIFDMLAGRLEIFPLLLLFTRETWKKF